MGNFRIFVLFPFFLMLMKRLRNLRPVVKSLLLLSLRYTFVTRRFYCWKKKKFVLKRERETELSNSWICIALKKSTWKWLKVWKKGNRYNSVAMVTVTDNLKKKTRLMCICWFSIFSCFVGGFTTIRTLITLTIAEFRRMPLSIILV